MSDKSENDSERHGRIAPAPFDKPGADVILRSADGVDFCVFRWILEDVSPVFANMFAIPQPASDPRSGSADRPVVDLTETSRTLEVLLSLCYPFSVPPTFTSFDDAKSIFLAEHKYEITRTSSVLTSSTTPHIKEHPLRVYAFAVRYGMVDLARVAAGAFLSVPNCDAMRYCDELEDISGGAVQRLIAYRKECVDAVFSAGLSATWCPPGRKIPWTWMTCRDCVKHKSHCSTLCNRCGLAQWFSAQWALVDALLRDTPSADAIRRSNLMKKMLGASASCSGCRDGAFDDIYALFDALTREIEGRISTVSLEIK